MERRDDPRAHGGSVAGAGAAGAGRPDERNSSLKRTQNKEDADDGRVGFLKRFQGCSCSRREEIPQPKLGSNNRSDSGTLIRVPPVLSFFTAVKLTKKPAGMLHFTFQHRKSALGGFFFNRIMDPVPVMMG